MTDPTECPSCDEIVDTLRPEGVCAGCWDRAEAAYDRRQEAAASEPPAQWWTRPKPTYRPYEE